MNTDEIRNLLAQHTGSMKFFTAGPLFRNVYFTEGVNHMADLCQAYWLIDAIASHIVTNKTLREAGLHFWKLKVEDGAAVLEARADLDLPILAEQRISYTDFPLEEFDIWAAPSELGWTIYLPSEH